MSDLLTIAEIEAEFAAACAKLVASKAAFLLDPIESRLREFTLDLRNAERLTAIVLDLDTRDA